MHQMGQKRGHPQMLDKQLATMFRLCWIAQSNHSTDLLLVCTLANAACAIVNIMTALIHHIIVIRLHATWWTQLMPVPELPAKWGHAAIVLLFLHGATTCCF